MAPDADAAKSLNCRPDPFAPPTSQLLQVGDGHEIHVESVGRADGIPAVYLHGGPGSERSRVRNLLGILCSHFQKFVGENRSRPNHEETSVQEMDAYDS